MPKGQHYDKLIENNLWIARKSAGYSQKQAAALLDITPGLISQYEQGRKIPSLYVGFGLEFLYGAALTKSYPALCAEITEKIEAKSRSMPLIARREQNGKDEGDHGAASLAAAGASSAAERAIHTCPCSQQPRCACLRSLQAPVTSVSPSSLERHSSSSA